MVLAGGWANWRSRNYAKLERWMLTPKSASRSVSQPANSTNNIERGFLRQINPLLKIALCLILTSIALVLQQIGAMGLLVGVLLFFLLASNRVHFKIFAYTVLCLVVFVGISAWLRDWHTSILSALRLMAILLPGPLLASTTSPTDLVRAFQAVRLPNFLVLSLMLTWRFLPLIRQETQRILEANQLRGVNLSRQPQQWLSGLFIPLIFRIVAYADDVVIGLETRGYDPAAPRSTGQPLTWQVKDTVFIVVGAAMLVTVGYMEWGA
ncbi:energy-coupling factor transporter transmembrane component T [Tumidithrix elongata RA019]|uniref:Energy-coupling factor transporter transmembrane component T n=1 Tax=Tumidithrix elongata BACA0141 TaxID=2716417 RepID=A0AAW9PYQ8_9CYAN|nr:energy-coupling factor transporter transmembrane component T [Tumidithrix elongata RA019]